MKISIIIIEFHCIDDVKNCLDSISDHLGDLDHECIIVSNSEYSGEELRDARKKAGDAHFVRTENNLGYAGGVNTGIRHSKGDFLYILNPDCILTDNGIINIAEKMIADPKWAITGPRVVDNNGMVQPSCRRFPRPWTFLLVRSFLSRALFARNEQERYLMHDFNHDEARAVDWVSGGALLVTKKAVESIGGMDERYFLYMEDVDWCHMAWDRGYKVMYCPESTVIHSGQHQSIRGGIRAAFSKHVRLHLTSMLKYFMKHGFLSRSRGAEALVDQPH